MEALEMLIETVAGRCGHAELEVISVARRVLVDALEAQKPLGTAAELEKEVQKLLGQNGGLQGQLQALYIKIRGIDHACPVSSKILGQLNSAFSNSYSARSIDIRRAIVEKIKQIEDKEVL